MVKDVLNQIDPLDKRKNCISCSKKLINGSKEIRCNNCQLVKNVSKNIVKKKKK